MSHTPCFPFAYRGDSVCGSVWLRSPDRGWPQLQEGGEVPDPQQHVSLQTFAWRHQEGVAYVGFLFLFSGCLKVKLWIEMLKKRCVFLFWKSASNALKKIIFYVTKSWLNLFSLLFWVSLFVCFWHFKKKEIKETKFALWCVTLPSGDPLHHVVLSDIHLPPLQFLEKHNYRQYKGCLVSREWRLKMKHL